MKSTDYQVYALLILHITCTIHVPIISDCSNRYPHNNVTTAAQLYDRYLEVAEGDKQY